MSALVNKGNEWLRPLMNLRNDMIENRNLSENRMTTRRNGTWAVTEDGHNQGAYTPKYRAKLLKQILLAQKEIQETKPNIELITNQELIAIQVIWYRDMIFEYSVSEIYNRIFNKNVDMDSKNEKIQKELELLRNSCENEGDYNLIKELLILQQSKAFLNRKRGLKGEVEQVLEKYLNNEN